MKNQDFQNRYTEQFAAGGRITRTLPLGGKLTKLWVVLTGTLHVAAGGGAAGANLYPEVLAGLLTRIRVRVSAAAGSRYPDGILRDLSPISILRRAQFMRGKYFADQLSTAFADAIGDYPIHYVFPISFSQEDMKRPIEYALNLDPTVYKNCQVEVDMGSRDTCVSASTRAWTYGDLTLEFIDARENIDGDTYVVVEDDHELLIPGAQTRLEDKNMPAAGALMDLLLLACDGTMSAGFAYANTIFNELRFSGGNADLYLKAADIRQDSYDARESSSAIPSRVCST